MKPKRLIASTSCSICFLLCCRALRGSGFNFLAEMYSISSAARAPTADALGAGNGIQVAARVCVPSRAGAISVFSSKGSVCIRGLPK